MNVWASQPFYPPLITSSAHFTEAAGSQLDQLGLFEDSACLWHLNGPALVVVVPIVTGTQTSPHALSSHGQTHLKQVLGRLCVFLSVIAVSVSKY